MKLKKMFSALSAQQLLKADTKGISYIKQASTLSSVKGPYCAQNVPPVFAITRKLHTMASVL